MPRRRATTLSAALAAYPIGAIVINTETNEISLRPIAITRDTIDALLDRGRIEVAMANGAWWRIRRNGATKRWKRDASRIYIPFKIGMYGYGSIDEHDFVNGVLNSDYYRLAN